MWLQGGRGVGIIFCQYFIFQHFDSVAEHSRVYMEPHVVEITAENRSFIVPTGGATGP